MTALAMWTVYDHPSDNPDAFVARRWAITAGEAKPELLSLVAADLPTLRGALASAGLTQLQRSEGDDPVIIETWI